MTLTVGDMLRRAREQKKISLEQLEKRLRIRTRFLEAIEHNDWQLFGSKIYISGIIKSYAQEVGVDAKKALVFFRRDYEHVEDMTLKKRVPNTMLRSASKVYSYIVFFGIGVIFLAYFGYQLSIFLLPPRITIVSPTEKSFKRRERITVTGRTEKEAVITIFGTRVYPNENGVFSYDLPLKIGTNQIVIEAIGANGKKSVIMKEFVLVP